MKSLWAKDQYNQCEIFNFIDLCSYMRGVWSTATWMSQWRHCCHSPMYC